MSSTPVAPHGRLLSKCPDDVLAIERIATRHAARDAFNRRRRRRRRRHRHRHRHRRGTGARVELRADGARSAGHHDEPSRRRLPRRPRLLRHPRALRRAVASAARGAHAATTPRCCATRISSVIPASRRRCFETRFGWPVTLPFARFHERAAARERDSMTDGALGGLRALDTARVTRWRRARAPRAAARARAHDARARRGLHRPRLRARRRLDEPAGGDEDGRRRDGAPTEAETSGDAALASSATSERAAAPASGRALARVADMSAGPISLSHTGTRAWLSRCSDTPRCRRGSTSSTRTSTALPSDVAPPSGIYSAIGADSVIGDDRVPLGGNDGDAGAGHGDGAARSAAPRLRGGCLAPPAGIDLLDGSRRLARRVRDEDARSGDWHALLRFDAGRRRAARGRSAVDAARAAAAARRSRRRGRHGLARRAGSARRLRRREADAAGDGPARRRGARPARPTARAAARARRPPVPATLARAAPAAEGRRTRRARPSRAAGRARRTISKHAVTLAARDERVQPRDERREHRATSCATRPNACPRSSCSAATARCVHRRCSSPTSPPRCTTTTCCAPSPRDNARRVFGIDRRSAGERAA